LASGRPSPAGNIAGVRYDPAAPLDATVQFLGGQGVTSHAVRYRGANNEPVPAALTLPASVGPTTKGAAPVPCVLLLHGLGGNKGDMFLFGLSFAAKGYATLAIDIAGHGERPRLGGAPTAAPGDVPLPEMKRAVATTVVDLRRAVDFLSTRP
jgi:alpha-beta hydrolase superfamily lysophospholipase